MSGFLGNMGTDTSITTIWRSDERLISVDWRVEIEILDVELLPASFVSPWWPRSGIFGDAGDVNAQRAVWRAQPEANHDTGGDSRFLFAGVTRDQYGSAVGSCTVKLFLTSTDTVIESVVSDASGNFVLSTYYYPDTHYITVHKSGTPDIDGITPNTLTGT